jgi:ribosome-binding factor A
MTGKAPTASQRQLRVGEEIRHALAELFLRGDVRDPGLRGVSLTITEVRVSPDLRNATAFVLPLGGGQAEAALAALARAAPWIRGEVTKRVRLRYSPHIDFRLDRSFDRASRIDELLRRPAVKEDLVKTGLGPYPAKDDRR